ncbi:hypothetical protein C8J56DRAFT_971837 [Mycena floridula]|nr:hypothetical protein C8J56DRAFT_971837 [Mycena floridula]
MRGYHLKIALKSNKSANTDTFVPDSLFQALPAHKPRSTVRQNSTYNPRNKDYRFGPIRIDWADMSKPSAGKEKDPGRGPAVATFVASDGLSSGSTNLPQGIVHLFRESNQVPQETTTAPPTPLAADSVTLGVLAVPSWMSPSDFLTFVAPAADGITHLRIIRDVIPNRCIVIIKFSDADLASEFAEVYNGKPFNSLEPEICSVVRVLSVNIDTEDAAEQTISRIGSTQSAMYELPTCPVCLERMDSAVTGLITVPCSHTFHCQCLSKWGDSRCPVCRYSQTLRSSHPTSSSSTSSIPIPFATPGSGTLSTCSTCSSTTNLWICLICGNIGCGRYGLAHAHAHYEATTHLYALELETQRVWDYAGDGYVHRLIQNKADGKLVELPSAASSMGISPRDGGIGPGPADALSAEKIEAIGIEYSYLLTSQLDSQRSYYEDQNAELNAQVGELKSMVEQLMERERQRQEEVDRVAQLAKEKAKVEAKAQKMTELARKLDKELREERAVSEGLMKNLASMKEKTSSMDKEREDHNRKIQDLEDQLRDVMFFLEARTKIENGEGAEAEAAGGSLEIVAPPEKAPPKKKKKTRK